MASFCEKISELFFKSILAYFTLNQKENAAKNDRSLSKIEEEHNKMKEKNLRSLRPNLSNPKCQEELHSLNSSEEKRWKDYSDSVLEVKR